MPMEIFEYAFLRFLDAQTRHMLAAGVLFLCIHSIFTKISVGSKRASTLIMVRYSDVLQHTIETIHLS